MIDFLAKIATTSVIGLSSFFLFDLSAGEHALLVFLSMVMSFFDYAYGFNRGSKFARRNI